MLAILTPPAAPYAQLLLGLLICVFAVNCLLHENWVEMHTSNPQPHLHSRTRTPTFTLTLPSPYPRPQPSPQLSP